MITSVSEAKLAISLFGTYTGELYDAFMKVSRNPEINEIYSFFHTKDAACASKFGQDGNIPSSIAISRNFDESPLKFYGYEEDLINFAKASAIPRVITFSEDYKKLIFNEHNPAIILFTEETDTAYQEVYAQAAKELQSEIFFITSGISKGI